jgi:uncharacterized protein
MNEQSNIARHKQGHEAFNRNDLNTLSELIAEDTLWHWYGRNQLAGDHRGRDALFEQFGKMAELTGGNLKVEPQDYLASGTKTAALMRFTATRGDRRLDARLCEVAEWRDGKLVEAWAYLTDQYTFDEFWS